MDDDTGFGNVTDVTSLSISRGMYRETKAVNMNKVNEILLYDELGNKINFCTVYKQQKTIVVLVRHLLCFICKEYVEDLARIPLKYLQEANVKIVVIGPSHYKFIKEFRKQTGYQFTFYCDPDRELYRELGCIEKNASGALKSSKHVKSYYLTGALKSTWRAMMSHAREWQGDIKQQGASLILGPGDVVHYSHIDQNATDHVPINELLSRAGVQQVSFDKDPRVQNL